MIAKGLESQSAGERNGFAYTMRSLDYVVKVALSTNYLLMFARNYIGSANITFH